MGLIASLALLRVHVLVVEVPGHPLLRLRAEAAVRARGWLVGGTPEDADLLLVCGAPRLDGVDPDGADPDGADPDSAAAVEALWARVPGPRARRTVRSAEDLPAALDSAARVLADAALQRGAAAAGGPAPSTGPAGRFGPFLPDWPAGLLVDCAVDRAGRVVAVGTRRFPNAVAAGEGDAEGDAELRGFVLPAAAAARLVRLAGWPAPALRLERLVDRALAGAALHRLRRPLRAVSGTVRRSATLRWVLTRESPAVDVQGRVLDLLAAAVAGAAAPPPAPRRLLGQHVDAVPLLVAATEAVPADG